MTTIESFMLNDLCEHYHFMPGQDCSRVCVDVMRAPNGRVFAIGWYSFGGSPRDSTGHKDFNACEVM